MQTIEETVQHLFNKHLTLLNQRLNHQFVHCIRNRKVQRNNMFQGVPVLLLKLWSAAKSYGLKTENGSGKRENDMVE